MLYCHKMKTAAIIGAGQTGKAIAELLNKNQIEIIGYGDNNENAWLEKERSIMSVPEVLRRDPDFIIIGVMGETRTKELKKQIIDCDYKGEVISAMDLYTTFDIRSKCIKKIIQRIEEKGVEGSLAELGVYKGDTAWQINDLMPNRFLYLFDTFNGFDRKDIETEEKNWFSNPNPADFTDTSEELVMARMRIPEKVIIRKGFFPDTAKGLEHEGFAFVSLDADLYEPTLAGLEFFYPRLNDGGAIVIHDYNNIRFMGVKTAVDDYERQNGGLCAVPLGDLHGSIVVVK